LTTGHQEWWTATRDMTVDVTVNDGVRTRDADDTANDNIQSQKVHVDKNNPHAEASFELVLTQTSTIDISVHGGAAVMAWIAVSGDVDNAPSVDKTELNGAIEELTARNLDQAKYTADSWQAFSDALTDAQRISSDEEATQTEVDTALATLNTAYQGLEEIGSNPPEPVQADKTALGKAIAAAANVDITKYTGESAKPFTDALADAQRVMADELASQQVVDDAAAALTQTQAGLVLVDAGDNGGAGGNTGDGSDNGSGGGSDGSGVSDGSGSAHDAANSAKHDGADKLSKTGVSIGIAAAMAMVFAGVSLAVFGVRKLRRS
jgi:uncharacterized membrane protein YgcG